jgi:hypothetical protein
MATKIKTYCTIIDYIDAVDPELSNIIKLLCAASNLTSIKGKPGITFLMPDSAYLAEIKELAYSDKTEKATQAADMINALIIRDVFRTPSDWKSKEAVNSLFPYQVVEVASTSANEVVFKSGAKAVIDDKFMKQSLSMDRSDNTKKPQNPGVLAVWKLTGKIPVTTDKPATKKNKKGAVTGGYNPGHLVTQGLRFKIALNVENAFAMACASGNSNKKCAYTEYTLSLLNHIMNKRKDTALMYDKVLPMLSWDKFDFYVLIEPHRNGGEYLLDDGLIADWWQTQAPFNAQTVCDQVCSLLKSGSGCAIYTDRVAVLNAIDKIRKEPIKIADSNKFRTLVDVVADRYDNFINTNSIGGVSNVLPAGVIRFYQNEPGLKMVHDELRYLTFGAFQRLESQFDFGAFHELCNLIGECLHANDVERNSNQKLLNRNVIKSLISPSDLIDEIKIFVCSTMFMYVPMTREEANNLKQNNSTTRPDPHNIVIFNIAKNSYDQHDRLVKLAPMNQDLADALLSLDVSKLDENVRNMLKAKLSI